MRRLLVENFHDGLIYLRILGRANQLGTILGSNALVVHFGRNGGQLYWVRHNDGEEVGLQRVAVDVELRNERIGAVQVLDLLERNILALSEFHDVL